MNPLSRRQILTHLAASPYLFFGLSGCQTENFTQFAEILSQHLDRKDLAYKVGKAYVKYTSHGETPDLAELVISISKQIGIKYSDLTTLPVDIQRHRLGKQIRADFKEERVIEIVGWVLSNTEIKLSLLVYLLQN